MHFRLLVFQFITALSKRNLILSLGASVQNRETTLPQGRTKVCSSLLRAEGVASQAFGPASSQGRGQSYHSPNMPNSGFLYGPKGTQYKFSLTQRGLINSCIFLLNYKPISFWGCYEPRGVCVCACICITYQIEPYKTEVFVIKMVKGQQIHTVQPNIIYIALQSTHYQNYILAIIQMYYIDDCCPKCSSLLHSSNFSKCKYVSPSLSYTSSLWSPRLYHPTQPHQVPALAGMAASGCHTGP